MKQTGFKKKSYEEVMANLRKKQEKAKLKPKTKTAKKKKTPVQTLRNKCDKLLTPIIIKQHPRCMLCPEPTQVAHHHVHKSKSSALRYDIENLINLCHKCHMALHHNESYHASRIVAIKGVEWFEGLEKRKNIIVKTNRTWYEGHLERLQGILNN